MSHKPTLSTTLLAREQRGIDDMLRTIGLTISTWQRHITDLEQALTKLRRRLARVLATQNRLIAHIARLEGTDIDTARTKHLPPEEDE